MLATFAKPASFLIMETRETSSQAETVYCENCKAVPVEIAGFVCETCMADHNVRAARRVRPAKRIEGDG